MTLPVWKDGEVMVITAGAKVFMTNGEEGLTAPGTAPLRLRFSLSLSKSSIDDDIACVIGRGGTKEVSDRLTSPDVDDMSSLTK
jgi:hypothetical protein